MLRVSFRFRLRAVSFILDTHGRERSDEVRVLVLETSLRRLRVDVLQQVTHGDVEHVPEYAFDIRRDCRDRRWERGRFLFLRYLRTFEGTKVDYYYR